MDTKPDSFDPADGDALIVVDLQQDFLPGGALAVRGGDQIVPLVNQYLRRFRQRGLPVFATRDWHPPRHCSFQPAGPWPAHCVAGTPGAGFAPGLQLPPDAVVVSKAQDPQHDAYSAFSGTSLVQLLRAAGVQRLFVAGLATDYCVLHTARDALAAGFAVVLLADAMRPVNLRPGDGAAAIAELRARGARVASLDGVGAV